MGAIDTVFNLGQDAYKSLFVVQFDETFPFFKRLGLKAADLTFRITQFDIPASPVATEEIRWWTQKLVRPGAQSTEDKSLTLSNFRVDHGYKVLQAFYDWKDACLNSYSGEMGDIHAAGLTTNITVMPVTSNSQGANPTPSAGFFLFENCWCSDVSGVSFSMDDSNHMTFSPQLQFLRFSKNIGRPNGGVAASAVSAYI